MLQGVAEIEVPRRRLPGAVGIAQLDLQAPLPVHAHPGHAAEQLDSRGFAVGVDGKGAAQREGDVLRDVLQHGGQRFLARFCARPGAREGCGRLVGEGLADGQPLGGGRGVVAGLLAAVLVGGVHRQALLLDVPELGAEAAQGAPGLAGGWLREEVRLRVALRGEGEGFREGGLGGGHGRSALVGLGFLVADGVGVRLAVWGLIR